jgi:large subunit ribosomal protein L24
MLARIKKNDTVVVLSGKSKGKRGVVLQVNADKMTVLVKGVNIAVRHLKARKQNEVAEIKRIEAPVNLSSVMLVCGACHVPSRVNSSVVEGTEKRVRICNRCRQIT